MTRLVDAKPVAEDESALRFAAAQEAALCTIVGLEGSFSRRLGAQLAIGPAGTIVGSLSDGCLDREIANQARKARETGEPIVLRYGRGSPFIDFRLPCGSGLDILVDPHPDRAMLGAAVAALDARGCAELDLPIHRPDLLRRRYYVPAPRLLILGAGPESEWLARLAAAYGTPFEIAGPGKGLALGRAPETLLVDGWTAIILMFHDHEWEGALLEWALGTPAFYIGAIGGALARENRRALLLSKGCGEMALARVKSPIGLIREARDARTLALSVLAEVVADYDLLVASDRIS